MADNQAARKGDTRAVMVVDGKLRSSDLFRGRKELTILHENSEYKLRLTGNGKLILTK